MDPRPFRCSYDPELAKATGGTVKCPHPVFVKPHGGPTRDPRPREPASRGKRAVPKQLPPAKFARPKAAEPRVHLSKLGPLVTRVQVNDAARFFGEVKSCEVLVARTTNSSLGVASVVYAGVPAVALKAAQQIVAACSRGSLTIGGVRGVHAALDSDRALLRRAQADANAEPVVTPPQSGRVTQPLSQPPSDTDVQLVELRKLTSQQIDDWYRRYIGPAPTYVLIPGHNISPLTCSVKEVAYRFHEHAVSRIAVNRTGFFVLFDSPKSAERCFEALDGKRFMHTRLKLALTLKGERVPGPELRNMRMRRRQLEASTVGGSTAGECDLIQKTNGAPRYNKEQTAQLCKSGVDALLNNMKRLAWSQFVHQTVINTVRKAIQDRGRDGSQPSTEPSVAPVTPESEESEPEAFSKTTFGARQMLRDTGKASRHLPPVRMRKRTLEPVDTQPRKVLKREPVAPKTYIRQSLARDLKRKHDENDENDEDDEDSHDDTETNDNTDGHNSDMEAEPAMADSSANHIKVKKEMAPSTPESERVVQEMDISDEALEEKCPFDLPPSPPPEDHHPLEFKDFKQLVHTTEDFDSLRTVLGKLDLPTLSEDEVRAQFCRKEPVKLNSVPSNWPEQPQSFRESPFLLRNDDERRSFLPVAACGLPNEIVQNYRNRPLYEEQEDEDPSKLELRKDARVLSRSSFGTGSDLFADDTLSKNVKDVRLARSFIHDWGLYANEHIPEGEFVIEYVGDVLRDEYADVRERNYMMEGIDSSYLFRLDNGTVIDATKRGNGARFINHSCDPNCVAQVFDHDGFKRVVLFSVRDIQPDEELTFDYNFVRAQDDEGKVRCCCGAANCRGWLI